MSSTSNTIVSGTGDGTYSGVKKVLATTVAEINAAALDAVVTSTHTEINLVPGQVYVVPVGTTITLYSAWCELEMNYAVLDFSGWGSTTGKGVLVSGVGSGIHDYTKMTRWKRVIRNGMLLNDPAKYVGTDDGVDLLNFDVPGAVGSSPDSNRVYIERLVVVGGRRNVTWKSASYFTKFFGCEFVRAYQCFDSLTGSVDFAEQIEFDTCLAGENRVVWGPCASLAGQIYNFRGGSIDYNDRISNTDNGTRVYLHDKTHIEWIYGNSAGQTLEPFKMSGAEGYFGGSCSMIYTGTNAPNYISMCVSDNSTNQFNFEVFSARNIGRTADRKSLDSFHRNLGGVGAQVCVKMWSPSQKPYDFPAMTTVSEAAGSYGMIRGGIGAPGPGLIHIIGKSGTAVAVSELNITDNGVNRKSTSAEAGSVAQPMLRFQNSTPGTAAKYYICFPKYERGAKAAWSAFFNTFAITAGSVVIKERRNGPAAVFDGTSVTFAYPSDGANYHPGTITLTSASSVNGDDWNRYDYRDTATAAAGGAQVQVRHDMTFLDIVEIDMTNATGFLYMSFIGCAPIGARV